MVQRVVKAIEPACAQKLQTAALFWSGCVVKIDEIEGRKEQLIDAPARCQTLQWISRERFDLQEVLLDPAHPLFHRAGSRTGTERNQVPEQPQSPQGIQEPLGSALHHNADRGTRLACRPADSLTRSGEE